nr:hypothetical protein [Treponema sp.]
MRNAKCFLPVLAAGFLLLASCSGKPDAGKNCVVRFSWWGKDSRTEYTLEGLTRFESMYPDITVEPE